MIDLYLRANTADEFKQHCSFLWDGKDWIRMTDKFVADFIGSIVLKNAVIDDEFNIIEPPVFDNGFHINIRCTEEVAALIPDEFKVYPETPYRVWA